MINAYRTLVGNFEGKRLPGRPRIRMDNFKVDLKNRMLECGLDSTS